MAKDEDEWKVPTEVIEAVRHESEALPDGMPVVRGYDFSESIVDYDKLLGSMLNSGFQATHFGQAVNIINDMCSPFALPFQLNWKPSKSQLEDDVPPDTKCTIFLGYTSNMVSSGVRESICFLAKHKLVDVLVTTAGGIEEDIIKCLGDTGVASFNLDGAKLRKEGLNRIGNLIAPNEGYCQFEDWIGPVLDDALERQKRDGFIFTPSTLIKLLGERIANERSICYWAAKNDIPIFCPAITDGAVGDALFLHSYRNSGLIVDVVQDIRRINRIAIHAPATGMIILGGGVVKHHIANANLLGNGADFSVYVITGQEFDGSDSGASPEEAVSWGKIKADAKRVKISADATLVFPLLVAQTFAKRRSR